MNDRKLEDGLLQGLADAREYTVKREYRPADPRVADHVENSMRGVWLRGEPAESPAESIRDIDRLERLARGRRDVRHGR